LYRLESSALFVWLISHQPTVLFSRNKPATSNQPAVLFSQNKSAPAISHQPNEQVAGQTLTPFHFGALTVSIQELPARRGADAPPQNDGRLSKPLDLDVSSPFIAPFSNPPHFISPSPRRCRRRLQDGRDEAANHGTTGSTHQGGGSGGVWI
jgi:hypothetical protein